MANVAALVTDGVGVWFDFVAWQMVRLPLRACCSARRAFSARNVAGDRVVRYRRSGVDSYADPCRSKADDLPNALLADI